MLCLFASVMQLITIIILFKMMRNCYKIHIDKREFEEVKDKVSMMETYLLKNAEMPKKGVYCNVLKK